MASLSWVVPIEKVLCCIALIPTSNPVLKVIFPPLPLSRDVSEEANASIDGWGQGSLTLAKYQSTTEMHMICFNFKPKKYFWSIPFTGNGKGELRK